MFTARSTRFLGRKFFHSSAFRHSNNNKLWLAAAGVSTMAVVVAWQTTNDSHYKSILSPTLTSCDIISAGTPIKEAATGILFPQLCNGMFFAGCGVRVKYGFVKVYAVATYVDPVALGAVKHSPAAVEEALLDPTYPRTIKIILNRNLSSEKFTAAIVEALQPRMMGVDLDKLEAFQKLMPPVELIPGAEVEMTIRGDTLLFKNPTGGVGTVHSLTLTKALCDVYYGKQCVSPGHKEQVLAGIAKL
ncbi:hypothetical protein FisN_32Lh059 [Fistulifera solaris]|jgi:hypothetical protein|uniref:Uncharacterized protein n=1 Tax=Fistulifera solaris TaxID=1519565 RepID=A0A1Z5JG08_FISSO|nr:hypothetical protein FisN_32Lh059 [Fistulifera solaris]|eukprot:GAX12919.1 hypothetical protein FisN_32Lh059 [Fistulifera solaris]